MIAVIEDDPAVLNSIAFSLEAEGYDVCGFDRALDALNSRQTTEADGLVIDYGLGETNGIVVLRTLRGRGQTCPAVIIVGAPNARCRREAAEAKAPLIEKPLTADVLSRKLGELLAEKDGKSAGS